MERKESHPLVQMADQLYTDARLDHALTTYRDALLEEPENAWIYNRIGAILAQMGDTKGAEYALQRAVELDPKLAHAHSNLGNLLYAQGVYAKALEKYRDAVALAPENPIFHENLHAAYKKLGKVSEAVAALKQSHRLSREQTKAQAKAHMETVRTKMRGRLGCTTVLSLFSLSILLLTIIE